MEGGRYLGSTGVGDNVGVRLVFQPLPVVQAQQDDAHAQEARGMREKLKIEGKCSFLGIPSHAIGCIHAH